MKKNEDTQFAGIFGKLHKKIFKRVTLFFYIVIAVLVIAFTVTLSLSNLMQKGCCF